MRAASSNEFEASDPGNSFARSPAEGRNVAADPNLGPNRMDAAMKAEPDTHPRPLSVEGVDVEASTREGTTLKTAGLELLLVSFIVLFQELALIRWIPSQMRVAAYFPNLVLISAFLGLGIGCLRAGRRSLMWLWPLSLVLLVGACVLLSGVAFTDNGVSDHLWLLYYDLPESAPVIEGVRLPLLLMFVLNALTFVALGQFVADRLEVFGAQSRQLWGYSLDLTGSLLGVIGFALLSFLGTFPIVWIAVVLIGGAFLMPRLTRHRIIYLSSALIIAFSVWAAESNEYYSPYYGISTEAVEGAPFFRVMTNGSLHQVASTVEKADPVLTEEHGRIRAGYHLPYDVLREVPERVLVLGGGTGNDVAVLLDQGVQEIDVVEIDPVILDLGRRHHPNSPYDSPRVRLINADARSFLNDTDRTYDLVVFGTLDSMTRLSALSNVRLDNFVYTLEGVQAAKARLNPEGGLVMYFMVSREHISRHLFGMLATAFGEMPMVHSGQYTRFNAIYVAGPAFSHLERPPQADQDAYVAELSRLPTDDWPFLYLESRSLGSFYLSLMAIFLLVALVGILLASREMRAGLLQGRGIDAEMFLYGVAFLLLETRFVTAMNLVWSATWLTSAVVFGSILVTILVATLLMSRFPMPWRFSAIGLIASLLVVYALPLELIVGHSAAMRLALSVALVGLPVFFAATCFALRFKQRDSVGTAFGWNLLGAVAGGLLEFFSMSVGLRALLLVAAAAYLGTFLLRDKRPAIGFRFPVPGNATARAAESATAL